MPSHISVGGFVGDAFIPKSELSIVGNELILTGQNKTITTLPFGIEDCLSYQLTGIPMLAICRQRIDTENHLPRAVLVMHGGVLVHLIGQVRVIGHKPIHEGDELVTIIHQPEMIAVMSYSLSKLGGSSSLSGRETLSLYGR